MKEKRNTPEGVIASEGTPSPAIQAPVCAESSMLHQQQAGDGPLLDKSPGMSAEVLKFPPPQKPIEDALTCGPYFLGLTAQDVGRVMGMTEGEITDVLGGDYLDVLALPDDELDALGQKHPLEMMRMQFFIPEEEMDFDELIRRLPLCVLVLSVQTEPTLSRGDKALAVLGAVKIKTGLSLC
jgi:hypothetical protein